MDFCEKTLNFDDFVKGTPYGFLWKKHQMKVIIPRTVCREKIKFFRRPEAKNEDMIKIFEMENRMSMLSQASNSCKNPSSWLIVK